MDELIPYRYIVKAQLVEPTDKDYEELGNIAKGFIVASQAPFEDGKPRMMFLQAWMAHEGRNLNGDAFVNKELEQKVKLGLFSPPYAGMIDLDHDFTARGFWYKTAYAFDEKAQKWGILATGAVWAWRYPEVADFVQQEMVDRGYIYVSMSAIAEAKEVVLNYPGFEGKTTSVLHNPVFFTSAILTVPPGDPDAKGVGTEVAGIIPASEEEAAADTMVIQSILFPKKFWKKEEAIAWVKKHNYKTSGEAESSTSYRFRQADPNDFDSKSFRTICLTGAPRDNPGSPDCKIKAIVGKKK